MALPLLILSSLLLAHDSGVYAAHLFMTLGLRDLRRPPLFGNRSSDVGGSVLMLWREDHILLKVDMPDPAFLHVSLSASIPVAGLSHCSAILSFGD
jgi:hypothetical protein